MHTARVRSCADRYHLAEFHGLPDNAAFRVTITSAATGAACGHARFTTLRRPPGPLRFRFATINDIHAGEKIYGLTTLPGLGSASITPGLFMQIQGMPFWQFTNQRIIRDLNETDLDFVIVKGDLTTDPTAGNMAVSKAMLDRLKHPYHVLRGNHDHQGTLPEDHFRNTFGLENDWYAFEHKGAGFVLLDCVHPDSGFCAFPAAELDWLETQLRIMEHLPVFVFLHNPPLRIIDRAPNHRIPRFLRIVQSHPRLAGVFYGHTHANKRITRVCSGRRVPFVETAATMDYPGGFNIYELYDGGFTQICIRPHDPLCCRWYEKAEGAYYGLARSALFGHINDRNFTRLMPLFTQ